MENNNLFFIFTAIFLFPLAAMAEPVEDKQALLDFIQNMHHSHTLNWSQTSSVCQLWTGVTCNSDQTRVIALRLPAIGLQGTIPPNTLSRLSAIETLSLRSNAISGFFPSDLSLLANLTSLHLQFNDFSGPLPSDFSVWKNLTAVDLSNNRFNGSIPPSLSNLTHLASLNLSNNSLSGAIPDINLPSLQFINLENNDLIGILPRSFSRFPSWAFSGNNISLENAVSPSPLPLHSPMPQPLGKPNEHRKLSESAILGIVIGGCVIGFVVIALMMICSCSKRTKESGLPAKSATKDVGLKKKSPENKNNRLVFFEGCTLAFDLEDLLRASAEVLGKGTFGTTYKAALEDTTTLVVKRLKEVTVAKKDFEQQMELIGSIKHSNVLELRAYYYSKDEKLTVCDFCEQGSVSALLHGNRGEGRIPLDWDTRLRIALGAAKGIDHIHKQNGGKLVHGNVKASNVFLNSEGYGCISDIGLALLMSTIPPPVMRAAGYRAPEITDSRKATHASDVYSFGVLLLELLTGKSAINSTGGEEVIHLVRWVNSVVREEWTAEVFDVELLRYPNIEEEMVEMLQIGMNCVVRVPEQRPKMADVVKMVEDIRRANTETVPSSETTPTPQVAEFAMASASTPQ